uniref:Killer cell lectin-like receptor subfamily A, member 1 n=4 Tax=Canis lupus TaxID=9612 RepID=A0A8P0TIZ8_CANLF
MSNEKVIYSSLRFLQSPESQNRLRADTTQSPGKKDGKGFPVPRHLIVVILGILCLLLLIIVAVLGTKIFQFIQENHHLGEMIGNLTQEYHILQNDSYLKDQLLTNKSLEYNILKNEMLQQKKEQDLLFTNRTFQSKNKGKLHENHQSCHRIKYYYFTSKSEKWIGCKKTCQSCNSSLLKISDEDELTFIQAQTYKKNYWIGLLYDIKEEKWKWVDTDLPFGINFTFMGFSGRGQCAFLSSTRVTNIDCSNSYHCICEKRIDNVLSASFQRYKKKRLQK